MYNHIVPFHVTLERHVQAASVEAYGKLGLALSAFVLISFDT